jgi:ketosteroid isomerase-like protein
MTTAASRELVRAFFQARLSCDPAKIAPLMDDDIEWSISGPVDILRYAGYKRGKDAVLKALVEEGPKVFKPDDLIIDDIVVEGDSAITRTQVIGVQRTTGRAISYQCAQLMRFRDGKLLHFRCIIDSFDAAEQVLGREIDISDTPLNAEPAIKVPAP